MISASLVKELREKTGAGMMDCKKALVETNGNLEISFENQSNNEVLFNAPVANQNQKICLITGKSQIPTICNSTIRNQYNWVWLHQSHTFCGRGIKLKFDLC